MRSMSSTRKKLPIGIQTFAKIRENSDHCHVDKTLMARSNSPTLGHPKFPQAGPPDYDDSGATAMRAAASLRR